MAWTASWPLLFIFQVPQVQLVPPLEKINFNTKPYSSYLARVPEMLLLLVINHILYRRDTYTCVMTITMFLAIPQNSSIRQNSVHIFRPDDTHDQNNFFPTFQETRQRKKFNSRLPDSITNIFTNSKPKSKQLES